MDDKFEPLKADEIISFGKDYKNEGGMFNLPLTFKAQELYMKVILSVAGMFTKYRDFRTGLFSSDGAECEVLKFGANGWQKGKIKLIMSIEFCPDEPEESETSSEEDEEILAEINEPESPLDDLRREFNQDNS